MDAGTRHRGSYATVTGRVMGRLELNFFSRSRVPVLLQSEAAECGLACVAMIAAYYRHRVSLAELRLRRPVSLKGMALDGIQAVARSLQLEPRALRLEYDDFRKLRLPCVLHWRMNHFVVLERVSARGILIADPASGRRKISHKECSASFTGVALEMLPGTGFRPKKESARLALVDLFRGNTRLMTPLLQILGLSLAIQVFALLTPAYLQLAIDQVVLTRDESLLQLLAAAFAGIAVIHAVASGFRAWCIFYFGTHLNFSWVSALFHRLMHLRLAFFEKRSVGDIQSRFGSIQPLRDLISSRAIEILVDGLMAVSTGIVIVLYGRPLALVVLASVTMYAAIRIGLFPMISARTREQLVANADAESCLLESIRGVLTIKNFSLEDRRSSRYRSRIADEFNATARVRKLTVVENSAELAIFSLQHVAIVYLGVAAILRAEMSVGMLVAFLAYSSQFSSRAANLIQGLLQFRLIRIHLDRIADISEATPEPDSSRSSATRSIDCGARGEIEVSNAWFRYSDDDQWILRGISLRVDAGECVGISAPSGFGKTTLLKVMVGLLRPQSGAVRFDGRLLQADSVRAIREHFGIVMQQDQLLAGSIAQNIAAFDDSLDLRRVSAAARIACIDEDIDRLPMRYLTLVGDMGDVFSGGQKQRILLARALYRKPRVLFLDEATSSLDSDNENRIVTALRQLPVTRIVIAHRKETLQMCDRVIELAKLGVSPERVLSTSG